MSPYVSALVVLRLENDLEEKEEGRVEERGGGEEEEEETRFRLKLQLPSSNQQG
jgi:hypothetical protein